MSGVFLAIAMTACLVSETASPPQPESELATKVFVEKSARRLTLLRGERVLRTYTVALGRDPVGPKERQGDGRTPEGSYVIDGRKETSGYHRSLHVSYPTPAQHHRALRADELDVNPSL